MLKIIFNDKSNLDNKDDFFCTSDKSHSGLSAKEAIIQDILESFYGKFRKWRYKNFAYYVIGRFNVKQAENSSTSALPICRTQKIW